MFERLATILAALMLALPALALDYRESTFWGDEVAAGDLPPVAERVPQTPRVVDPPAKGREFGTQGGTLRTMVTRTKDVRQMVVYGYARLMGYDRDYTLQPDLLRAIDVEEGRRFTLHLRPGHRWSDGAPFTSDDFAYWWNHVATHPELSPSGPEEFLRVRGELPDVRFPDAHTVIFEWAHPNPDFLQALAQARPPFIYRPAHYLRQYHADFADPDDLKALMREKRVRSWAALHNRYDNMYKFDNHELPTLQPWMLATAEGKSRFLFVRNPFYHRVDARGVQLPYIDVVEMLVVGPGLVAAKSNAGEVDLQARGLDFNDVSILKKGEAERGEYRVLLWDNGTASQIAIYPNLNFNDPLWRGVMRDVRFRRALSLGIDRRMINRALYFGLGDEGGMTVLPQSPFFRPENRSAWARYDPQEANRLLDEMGLTERDDSGIRLLPDGRPAWFVIETAGERQEVENALQIITDTWREIGIKLVMRPLERGILRNRVYSGVTMASVWYGWDNGLPQADTRPAHVAPHQQDFLAWPKWGQHYQTHGELGEPPDMPAARRLMDLADEWARTASPERKAEIWQEMVDIHAENVFAIGILSGAPQPVVVSNRLRNVPQDAIWAWDPGAHFGIHRMDEFFFADDPAPEGES
ncbi:peptide/nickel transport system substrate-binding protein [Salinihabitans flavidus]|uniref:Peptide/nickel transport system substrate-binding protein n=1 Tax=Salinihabitans flavidus TaxID=569882 RepID=A0A1H8QW65_9RHOB|nr:ABC transporter substrate-binding protein [Salinihabitans flavidus]SEO58550.1 peptide/nickel transport system substrate-binding protein [Salinihabitans flavidus]